MTKSLDFQAFLFWPCHRALRFVTVFWQQNRNISGPLFQGLSPPAFKGSAVLSSVSKDRTSKKIQLNVGALISVTNANVKPEIEIVDTQPTQSHLRDRPVPYHGGH